MAITNSKGGESLLLVLVAALTGVVVKTASRGNEGTGQPAAGDASSTTKSSPALHKAMQPKERLRAETAVADGRPAIEHARDPSDVRAVVRQELGLAGSCPSSVDRVASFGAVIALLPDPATSGFVGDFDNGLDAIQEAAQSQGYTVYRHWLPWLRDGTIMTERTDATRAGWILLRQDLPDTTVRALLVLVVGERVGSGVQRAMLDDALGAREELEGTTSPLLILGPYFSGTAATLRDGLESWCSKKPGGACATHDVAIVSGTATRPLNVEILESTSGLTVRFKATVNPDEALSAGMHHFLRDALGVKETHIAELTETSTPFGSAHAGLSGIARPRSSKDGDGAAQMNALRISFPSHLPDLRAPPDGTTAPALTFRDDEVSVDTIPLLALGGLTEGKQILSSTIEALRRQGITDVGILATSAADKISLVTQLRRADGDIRPHVYEANLGLTVPEQHRAMDGTLVVSSYPLSSTTQIWFGRSDVQPFTSDAAEGIYNALLALLWRRDLIGAQQLKDSLRDYTFPFGTSEATGPPIWISVLVGGQLWPLAAYRLNWPGFDDYVFGRFDSNPDHREAEFRAATLKGDTRFDRNRFATVALAILLVVVAGNALGLIKRMARMRRCPFLLFYDPDATVAVSANANTRGGWDDLLCLKLLRDEHARPAVVLGIWVTSLIGLVAGLLYELPMLLPAVTKPGPGDLVAVLLLLASGLLLLVPFVARPEAPARDEPRDCWDRVTHPGHWSRLLVHGLFVAAAGLGTIFTLVSFTALGERADGRAFLLFARLMNPGLGLTPALPVAVMAVALYVSCLFRLRVVRRGGWLAESSIPWQGNAVPGVASAMNDFAEGALRSMARVLWVGAALGVTLFLWTGLRPRSLEGPTFDFMVALGFGLVFAVAVAAIWRADRLWRKLAAFLNSLAVHPWAPAFSTLPGHISQAFRTPMPGRLNPEEVARASAIACALADNNPILPPAPAAATGNPIPDYLVELEPTWKEVGARPPALGLDDRKRPLPVQLREHVLALHMAASLSHMCDITRTTLFVGSSAAVAAVLGTALYPFQPSGALMWAGRISIAVVVLVSMRVIAGIERNQILSHIAGTGPGELTPSWSLAMRLVGYVIVPLGALAAAHLPDHGFLAGLLSALNGSLNSGAKG